MDRSASTLPNKPTSMPPPTHQSTSSTPKSSKRKLIVFLIITILVLGVMSIAFLNKPFTPSTPGNVSFPGSIDGLGVAIMTSKFLEKDMLPDGRLPRSYNCLNNSCSPEAINLKSQQTAWYRNGYASLAFWDLYKKTEDTKYKALAERTIQPVLNGCQQDVNFCFYSLKALYNLYKDTSDNRYKEAALKATDEYLKNRTLNESITETIGGGLWMLYDLTGDNRFKERLEQLSRDYLAGKVNQNDPDYIFGPFYSEGRFEVREYQIWAAGDILISTYKATNNPTYLQAAQDFFDKAKVTSHIIDFRRREQAPDLNAIDYLLDLAEVSMEPKKSEYVNQAHTFTQEVILGLWDSSVNPKFNGDNGFLFLYDKPENFKRKLHSGYRISQLIKLADRDFQIR